MSPLKERILFCLNPFLKFANQFPFQTAQSQHSSVFSFCCNLLQLLLAVALTTEITGKKNSQYLPFFFSLIFSSMTLVALLVGRKVWGVHLTVLASLAKRGT